MNRHRIVGWCLAQSSPSILIHLQLPKIHHPIRLLQNDNMLRKLQNADLKFSIPSINTKIEDLRTLPASRDREQMEHAIPGAYGLYRDGSVGDMTGNGGTAAGSAIRRVDSLNSYYSNNNQSPSLSSPLGSPDK